jgi:hypothetical protein
VRGNLRRFPRIRPWRSLRNEADFPLVVWAFAHRADTGIDTGAAEGTVE